MPNPRDWFRRRPAAAPEGVRPQAGGESVLDLGQNSARLREPPPLHERKPLPLPERRGPVPPPRAPLQRREGVALDRSAFTIRPELVHARPAEASNSPSVAAFSVRRGAAAAAPRAAVAVEPEAAPLPEVKPRLEPRPVPAEARPQKTEGVIGGESAAEAQFVLGAPGSSWKRGRSPLAEAASAGAQLREAFTPTRPKQDATLFSGRFKQMQRIIAAIEEERAHIVIYGERGSGKTSLANVLAAKSAEAGYFVQRFACSSDLTFSDIFRSLLRRMPATLLADGVGAISRARVENFEQLVPPQFGVPELIATLERVHDRHVILIIDEYDRVTAEDTKAKFAELIKNMSDAAAPVTLVIIGVADNVRELLGKHPSLQRSVVIVPMPLMTRREIDGIIAAGEEKSGLRFETWARQAIVEFAQGLPYHAQVLSLFAARHALRRQSPRVEREDVRYAIERVAEEAEPRLKEAYDLAIGPHENASFRDVLFHAARCRTDEFGTFTAADVAAAAASTGVAAMSLLALQYPLKKLTEPERGAVLRRIVAPGGLRYQFVTQMMRHHVLMRQAEQRQLI
jgi:Cdc6-like AAA superfamily ATPase